jgi:hypothetical protein
VTQHKLKISFEQNLGQDGFDLALITQVSSVIVGEVSREYGNYIDQ